MITFKTNYYYCYSKLNYSSSKNYNLPTDIKASLALLVITYSSDYILYIYIYI